MAGALIEPGAYGPPGRRRDMGYRENAADYRRERILSTFDGLGLDEAITVGYGLGLSEEETECILSSNDREFDQ